MTADLQRENEKKRVWERIAEAGRAFEAAMDPSKRKGTGFYLTGLGLAETMIRELVAHLTEEKRDIPSLRFLEPCVGTGNFVFAYLKAIDGLHLPPNALRLVLDNLYVADINAGALALYRELLTEFAKVYFDISLDERYFREHIGGALLLDPTADEISYIDISSVFPFSVVKGGFDLVVTNPPYKNLKAERQHYANDAEFGADKQKYAEIAKLAKRHFPHSAEGVLNLYKLFLEEIVDSYAERGAYLSLLLPSSVLSDRSCAKLRTHLLLDNKVVSIRSIGEGAGLVDAQQAVSAVLIKKGESTKSIELVPDHAKAPARSHIIDIHDILDPDTGNAIFPVGAEEYQWLRRLKKFPAVKDLPYLVNLRGELDLTDGKRWIVSEKTAYRLLRGRHIGLYDTAPPAPDTEYVSERFLAVTKKKQYIAADRIACQQIANMGRARRVTFAYIPSHCVLGNSCNFIALKENPHGIDLYTLLGLFNSSVIDWYFKLTSSNNHVNNYEIDRFPVPVGSPLLKEIGSLCRRYLQTGDSALLSEIETLAREAYGVDPVPSEQKAPHLAKRYREEIGHLLPQISLETAEAVLRGELPAEAVLADAEKTLDPISRKAAAGITDKFIKLQAGKLLNHTTFKLSALDLEMVRTVPQGGSWKNIPEETVTKSKRLMRITQTGGRTTLYGRIDYGKPSYTITTYFNRPGNGSYIHPVHDRVLSAREAARFQGFSDDYYFYGNKTQLLKQIGNALPPILAYQIAKQIVLKTGCSRAVDLFCGAGGMTAGFRAAGIRPVIGNDIEESACVTWKINSPDAEVLCADITEPETKKKIIQIALQEGADIICGGPPCQGFSLAGFRNENDPRNRLFQDFVEIVNGVKPKAIVFENVEGLLSFRKGKVYRDILTLFSELGYRTEGRTLMANEYGVPQRRKRVIVICTRNDLSLPPAELFPPAVTEDPGLQMTAFDCIADLENIPCGENAMASDAIFSPLLKLFKGYITLEEYIGMLVNCPMARSREAVQLSLDLKTE